MGDNSKISWTEATWNPVTGCTKISAGCKNCYAEKMADRLRLMGQANYQNGFEVTMQPEMLDQPARWTRPRMIFVNSMSDLFHKDVPLSYLTRVFEVIQNCHHHVFQILTKRPERMSDLMSLMFPEPLPNVWLGVSVEGGDRSLLKRVGILLNTPAAIRFVSFEPLIGDTGLRYLDGPRAGQFMMPKEGLHWAIFGGESGPGARPMELDWVRTGLEWCRKYGVAPFVKQLGTFWARKHRAQHPKGGDPAEWPEDLRVQMFPAQSSPQPLHGGKS